PRPVKRASGRTLAERTPLAVRTTGVDLDPDLRDYVRKRMSSKLGRRASHIERVSVRFVDVNGPRGGVDTVCRIKGVLSGQGSVVLEKSAEDARAAVDLAGEGVARAVQRALDRSRGRGHEARRAPSRSRPERAAAARATPQRGRRPKRRPLPPPEGGSLIGR